MLGRSLQSASVLAPDHFERESQWRTSFNMDPGWRKRRRNVKLKISRKSTAGYTVDHLPRAIQQHYLHVPNFLRRIWPVDHVNSQSGAVLGSISDWSVIIATMQQKESFITDGIRDECSRRNQFQENRWNWRRMKATCRLRGDGDRRELMKTLLSSLTRRLSSQLSGAQVDYFLPASSELK